MAPKYANKKIDTSRRHDESPEPSGSIEEYPLLKLRAATVRVTHRVTRGQVCQAAKTIIWAL